MAWHSIHVHYHGQGTDDLILDAVRPAFAAIGGDADRMYYVRHWRRGPHLRLSLRAEPERFTAVVLPAASEVIGGYLAARPSGNAPDPEELLPMHRRLAELEREPGPLLPWRPDNSLLVEPYDRRLHVLGSEAAADLLADYLAATTELSFDMTDHVRSGGQRLGLAFDLMVAVAHALGGGITRGFISFRSHAEGFLYSWPEGKGRRARWDALYRARATQLTERVRTVVSAVDEGSGSVPFASAWVRALRPIRTRGRQLIRDGALSMDYGSDDGVSARTPSLADLSPFHQRLYTNEKFTESFQPSEWFAVYRLVLNYTYLQLTRLGVTPVGRMLVCHLAANAVEQTYGCSAMELIAPTPRAS